MLSKSRIIRGMQCPKSLWLYTHRYDEQDAIGAKQQAIFSTGTNVGELAQDLWPGGIDASEGEPYPNKKCAQRTQELLFQGQKIIYEATFIFDKVLVAIDILAMENGEWNAYEVKSSASVKEVNLDDASIQYYVIKGGGVDVKNISIVHIDTSYIRKGALELDKLFYKANVTSLVLDRQDTIKETVRDLKEVIQEEEMPEREIGAHCSSPYGCSFMGTCWKGVPDYSVFNLSRLRSEKAFEMYHDGIVTLEDIPDSFELSDNQRLQVEAEKSQETTIDKKGIASFIKELNYPLYFLDYETINPAIPMFDHTWPYQFMPFQYSLHVQYEKDNGYTHYEFLAPTDGIDPREAFIKQLIEDCDDAGDILVYNIAFERSRTMELATAFPKYKKALHNICDRLKDLMIPFQQKMYYTPAMRGRYSIKVVLPALVPELSYDELEIADGAVASTTFLDYFVKKQELPKDTRNNLIEYCKLDTWAMVKILEKLNEI